MPLPYRFLNANIADKGDFWLFSCKYFEHFLPRSNSSKCFAVFYSAVVFAFAYVSTRPRMARKIRYKYMIYKFVINSLQFRISQSAL